MNEFLLLNSQYSVFLHHLYNLPNQSVEIIPVSYWDDLTTTSCGQVSIFSHLDKHNGFIIAFRHDLPPPSPSLNNLPFTV
jgi:hypothetical protein